MLAIVLVAPLIVCAFAAYVLPRGLSRLIAIVAAAVAIAVNALGYFILILFVISDFTWLGLFFGIMGFFFFPLGITVLGLFWTLRQPPRPFGLLVLAGSLAAGTAVLWGSIGAAFAPSAAMEAVAAIFLLGSWVRTPLNPEVTLG